MKKRVFLFLLLALLLTSCKLQEKTTLMFINSSDSYSSYKLLDDNINPHHVESGLKIRDLDNGYIYYKDDGSESYYFLNLEGDSNPVMTYYRFNNIKNENGELFGMNLGDNTYVKTNKYLQINKNKSILKYLIDQGFEINYHKQYVYNLYKTINNEHINWHYLIKDDIFINIALETNKGQELAAYEIGINNDIVNKELIKNNEIYNVSFVDKNIFYISMPNYDINIYVR